MKKTKTLKKTVKTKKSVQPAYPYCERCRLRVLPLGEGNLHYIPHKDIQALCEKMGKRFADKFHNYYGIQTADIKGLYAHDVESVLHRIFGKKLTGTQLFWD